MSDDIKTAPPGRGRNIKTPGPIMLKKTSSGEHPIMQAVRQEMDSTRKGPLSDLKALNKRMDKLKAKSDPPANPPPDEEEPIPDTEPEGGRT